MRTLPSEGVARVRLPLWIPLLKYGVCTINGCPPLLLLTTLNSPI